ncbi:hypothetical protein HDU91_002113, partial [Kappamyces sp. JEL0680]
RCIRVYDTNDNGHAIDINSVANDAKAIRDKVYAKLGTSIGATADQEYELYIRAKAFNSSRFIRDTSIDDLTLLEICSNPDHPYRAQLEFDKKRHPRVMVNIQEQKKTRGKERRKKSLILYDQASRLMQPDSFEGIDGNEAELASGRKQKQAKLEEFFGENVDNAPSRRRRRRKIKKDDGFKQDTGSKGSKLNLDAIENNGDEDDDKEVHQNGTAANMSKLVDFFGENVAPAANSKLADFFGEGKRDKKAVKKRKESYAIPTETDSQSVSSQTKPKKGSKKLEAFFGDRPPQEMIAKNLEAFFPGLNNTPSESLSGFQDVVIESAQNKRISKLQNRMLQRKQIAEKRKNFSSRLQLDLGEDLAEGMESILSSLYDLGSSTNNLSVKQSNPELNIREKDASQARKRPLGINLGKDSNFIFATIDGQEETPPNMEKIKEVVMEEQEESEKSSRGSEHEHIVEHVEEMLNLPTKPESTLELTASLAEFRDAFAIEPDSPKRINWLQGPLIGSGSFGK